MSDLEIINRRWKLLREDLRDFKKWFSSYSKVTQDKIQEIFDSYNINYESLYKHISKNDENRLLRKISLWKNAGLYKGYFQYHVEELIKKGITYIDLLEILLYGVFIEEQEAIETNINLIFDEVAKDCYNQGREELGKKPKSIIPFVIFTSFSSLLIDGCTWKNYIDALILTNMQEIKRQHLINLQSDINSDVYGDIMQTIFEKQRNRLISINDDKYSGGLDKYLTALGNLALVEAGGDNNQKMKFISDRCEHVTKMCEYMDGMIFNTKDRNKFKRPVGTNSKDLTIQEIDIMGLTEGINQPPITNHFHWCHSTLTYLVDKTYEEIYNITNKEAFFEKININQVDKKLREYEKAIRNSKIENMIIIQPNGMVYRFIGDTDSVSFNDIDLTNAIITHNHPIEESNYSFESDDRRFWDSHKELNILRGTDEKYLYQFSRKDNITDDIQAISIDKITEEDYQHNINIRKAQEKDYGYTRKKVRFSGRKK